MNTSLQIPSFEGEYRWLSNFVPVKIKLGGEIYPSVEHAYQAAKTLSLEERTQIRLCTTPGEAKKLGKHVSMRPHWEKLKLQIMEAILREKFKQEPYKTLLLATGNTLIEEGNYWKDEYWGIYQGRGSNHLGILIMQIRDEMKERKE